MKCPACGKENPEDLNFCPQCGQSLTQSGVTPTSPVPEDGATRKPGNARIIGLAAAGVAVVTVAILLICLFAGSGKTVGFASTTSGMYTTLDGRFCLVMDGRVVTSDSAVDAYRTSTDGKCLYYIDVSTNEMYCHTDGKSTKVADGVYSILGSTPDGTLVFWSEKDGTVHRLNRKNGKDEIVCAGGQPNETIIPLACSPNGQSFAYVIETTRAFFTENDLVVWCDGRDTFIDADDFIPFTVSDDGKFMYGIRDSEEQTVLCTYRNGEITEVEAYSSLKNIWSIGFNADGTEMRFATDDGTYVMTDGTEKKKVSSENLLTGNLLADDGAAVNAFLSTLYRYSPVDSFYGRWMFSYRLESGEQGLGLRLLASAAYLDTNGKAVIAAQDVNSVTISTDQSTMVYVDADGNLYRVNASDPKKAIRLASGVREACITGDGKTVYAVHEDGTLYAYRGKTQTHLSDDVSEIYITDDDEVFLVTENGSDARTLLLCKGTKVSTVAEGIYTVRILRSNVAYTVRGDGSGYDLYVRQPKTGEFKRLDTGVQVFTWGVR